MSQTIQSFEAFFELWLIHQERYLQDLVRVIECGDEQRSKDLVDRITAHYGEYYRAKSEAVQEDVFLVISPTWFTSFERAHLWVGGFRPGLAFCLVFNNVPDLTDDQSERINGLMTEIVEEEKQISDEFDRVEEGMVCRQMVEVARQAGRPLNGAENSLESAVDRLKSAMEDLVDCADLLRKKTGVALLEILKPSQAARFLAAVAELQLRIRRWGMQMDTAAALVGSNVPTQSPA